MGRGVHQTYYQKWAHLKPYIRKEPRHVQHSVINGRSWQNNEVATKYFPEPPWATLYAKLKHLQKEKKVSSTKRLVPTLDSRKP